MYKVDKGIPIRPWGTRRIVYPFDNMEIGDSFLVDLSERHRVASASCYYGSRHKVKFTTRKEGKDKLRVWRTK